MKTGVTILRDELESERGFKFTDTEWLEYMDNSITIATFKAMEKYADHKSRIQIEKDRRMVADNTAEYARNYLDPCPLKYHIKNLPITII